MFPTSLQPCKSKSNHHIITPFTEGGERGGPICPGLGLLKGAPEVFFPVFVDTLYVSHVLNILRVVKYKYS
jgi:hypothetical protein